MSLVNNDTAVGRAGRVLLYQVIILAIGFILNPDIVKSLTQYYPALSGVFLLGAPVLSAVVNLLRQDVPNS